MLDISHVQSSRVQPLGCDVRLRAEDAPGALHRGAFFTLGLLPLLPYAQSPYYMYTNNGLDQVMKQFFMSVESLLLASNNETNLESPDFKFM